MEEKTKGSLESYLRPILKNNKSEYIIDQNLKIKDESNTEHPTIKMFNEIKEKIENQKNKHCFNLGEELKFLSKPPYGLYTNMINMALMGFLMREFIGKLYEDSTGKPLEEYLMKDKILDLFKYWQNEDERNKIQKKLEVRFGTVEEKKLINILKSLFKLGNVDGLTNTRWKIRDDFIKKAGYPLWALKYCSNIKISSLIIPSYSFFQNKYFILLVILCFLFFIQNNLRHYCFFLNMIKGHIKFVTDE